jgi:predicted permease
MSVDLGLQGYKGDKGKQFYRQLIDRVQTLPGVGAVSIASYLPLSLDISTTSVYVEGQPVTKGKETPEVYFCSVEPGYFHAMGIPLLAGRDFSEDDKADSTKVVVVNETFAKRFWPGENAVGKRVHSGNSTGNLVEIAGIVKDGKYFSLGETPHAFMYSPMEQSYSPSGSLIVRTTANPETMLSTIRREVQQLDPNLPVFDVKTLSEHMGVSLFPLRIGAWVVGSFGGLALVLAAIGIYGTMAYSVSQRNREIGIRMALGASRGNVLKLIVKQGLILAVIGFILGLAGGLVIAIGAASFLDAVLYGVRATDMVTFVGVTFLLGIVVLIACLIPAQRATRVDPIIALRYE